MSIYSSPLRYPGGKVKLTQYIMDIFELNSIEGGHYVEPYAGGAGVAISLLFSGVCDRVHLNDLNYPLFCFWKSILGDTERFCRKVHNSKISVAAWRRHKKILKSPFEHSELNVGYAFFFLNRTNRSGIINGGIIGGYEQNGQWKIDARFNKNKLIDKIIRISEYKDKISLYNLDAEVFLKEIIKTLPRKTLIYIDPPYYNKGQRLYDNHYKHQDHEIISKVITKIKRPWVVSYDYTPEIKELYKQHRVARYSLDYSAACHYKGTELMAYSNKLILPRPNRPGKKIAA